MRINIEFYFQHSNVVVEDVEFPECNDINEIRKWINSCRGFINARNKLINLSHVLFIEIFEVGK